MAKKQQTRKTSFFTQPLNNVKTQFKSISKNKRNSYFAFLAVCIVSLILCLWGAITITIEQQAALKYLISLRDANTLEQFFPELALGGSWYQKGVEAFSWYRASIEPYGATAYYFAAIFGIIATPLLIYYISSFLIVCFPRKLKSEKKPKKGKRIKKGVQ